MKTLALDFETFFSADFTLKKLTTEAYIRDPQFEALCLGIYDPTTKTKTWIGQEDIPRWGLSVDWAQTAVLAHHAHFDGLIFAHHYGVRPAFWFDTLCMARAIHGNHVSVSLANLLKLYDIPEKTVPYDAFRGRRWVNILPELRHELGQGAADDCHKTWQIFQKLLPGFPLQELRLIDMTVRMFTEPQLIGDVGALQQVQADEWVRKDELLQRLGVSKADLNSTAKFAALLEELGVEVDTKTTPTGNVVPAIAATDPFMKELETHVDPTVADLARARLEVRSTINETRAGRLAGMAGRGRLPIYLQYCGAHTTRWSGGDKVNLQNLPRSGELRRCISAPDGYLLLEPDLSQIECRILLWLAGQFDQLDAFRQGRDLYSEMASKFYGVKVSKAMPAERGTGKQLVLSCGYGAGAVTIQATAARGTYGPAVQMGLDDAERAKNLYRSTNYRVVAMWKEAEWLLGQIILNATHEWGPMRLHNKRLYLPNGLAINYETVSHEQGEFKMRKRAGITKMYGAKLVENAVQGLARVVVSQAMLRLSEMGYKALNTTHDSLMILLPDDDRVEATTATVLAELSRPPTWMPDIPLAAEGRATRSYAK